MQSELEARRSAAYEELAKLLQDRKEFPINYNHYYTDTVCAKRQSRMKKQILKGLPASSSSTMYNTVTCNQVLLTALDKWDTSATADMEEVSCEEAVDCLMAIYKVGPRNACLAPSVQIHLVPSSVC